MKKGGIAYGSIKKPYKCQESLPMVILLQSACQFNSMACIY